MNEHHYDTTGRPSNRTGCPITLRQRPPIRVLQSDINEFCPIVTAAYDRRSRLLVIAAAAGTVGGNFSATATSVTGNGPFKYEGPVRGDLADNVFPYTVRAFFSPTSNPLH